MKTENCAEIKDAKSLELKSGLTEPAQQNPYGGFIIPAGILIGLGVGKPDRHFLHILRSGVFKSI